jgi:hypothetical protein
MKAHKLNKTVKTELLQRCRDIAAKNYQAACGKEITDRTGYAQVPLGNDEANRQYGAWYVLEMILEKAVR